MASSGRYLKRLSTERNIDDRQTSEMPEIRICHALILRAPRNATEARRPPRRGRGGASVRAGAPRAGLLSRLSRKGKRCLSGPQSVHASRGALFKPRDHADCSIPGVLFPGSCRPDCTLSHHTVQASAASAALREGRSPQGGAREGTREVTVFTLESAKHGTGDRRVTQSLATPAGSFPPA